MSRKILIPGGAGFIGSYAVRRFVTNYLEDQIFNLDLLTYAGNLENLNDIQNNKNYQFIKGDISNEQFINELFEEHRFDSVIHLAAESHVDRSISDPLIFCKTNVIRTIVLLNAFKRIWKDKWEDKLFYHISTDEVYGTLGSEGFLQKQLLMIQIHPIQLSKLAQIIL